MIFGELWGISVTLSQSVVSQLIGQGCAADTQQTGSLCDIVVGLFKSRHYLLLLYRLVSESKFHRHFGFRLEKRYVLFHYCVAVCVEGGEKDYILQFRHVARPRSPSTPSLPLSAFTSPIPEADDSDNVTSTLPFPRNSFKEDAVAPSILPKGV